MTFNTGNPIGSTDARDRSDNSENLDFAVNSLSKTFVDRLGRTRDTLEGVYQKSAYYRAGTFDAGYTLTNNRQTLAYGNVEYSWSGSFPKVVAAGSAPTPIGSGGWIDRSDVTLRNELLAGPIKLRNSILALRDFVSIFDGFGVVGNGVAYDHVAISSAIESADNLIFPPATYRLNSAISSAIGNNKKLLFMPGAKFISDNLSDGIMYFHDVGDGFSILGNPTLEYSSAPAARLSHSIYVRGKSITNLMIDGPEIKNGANMAVAVFCGKDGNVAVGSKNITVCNIKSSNTLGDTVHIEGADSDVNIYNVYAENSGDDVVAVVNYTGVGSAPTHPTQTKRVQIKGVTSSNAVTSTISLGGVADFVVDGVVEQAKLGSTCLTVKMVHDGSYAVGNSDGVISNVITDGANKIVALDTPVAGTAFNTGITFDNIKGKNILDSAIFASNSDGAAAGRLSDITIKQLDATLAASARPWYINNTKGFSLGKVTIRGGAGAATMAGNIGFKWDDIKLSNLVASADNAMTIITSDVDKAGNLTIDATGRPVGLQYQSNTKTVHDGLWSVNGASVNNFVFGSNSNKSGWFGEVTGRKYIGASVSAGTTTDIVFDNPPAVNTGSNYCTLVSATSNEGGKWGYKNAAEDKLTMVWSENLSYVFVSYIVKYRVI